MLLGNGTARFGHGLCDFASAHSGGLPRKWINLNRWLEIKGRSTSHGDTLDEQFRINVPRVTTQSETPTCVSVLDERIQSMQPLINETIHGSSYRPAANRVVANQYPRRVDWARFDSTLNPVST